MNYHTKDGDMEEGSLVFLTLSHLFRTHAPHRQPRSPPSIPTPCPFPCSVTLTKWVANMLEAPPFYCMISTTMLHRLVANPFQHPKCDHLLDPSERRTGLVSVQALPLSLAWTIVPASCWLSDARTRMTSSEISVRTSRPQQPGR